MKRQSLQIIGIKEGGENQVKSTENIFNKIIEKNLPILSKRHAYQGTNTIQNTK